ncbi:MAG: crossover junction endodeoxyribonuclease RuvC [Candidatus Omnitrophica bacterium]|nr:crossover junction endodeoxyribonuclease RuvC [Candidatus Omnitrophota bacterium]
MKILGVDPGLAIMGYGLIEVLPQKNIKLIEAGVVRTSSKADISTRLKNIYNNFADIIKENKPDVVVLEKLYSHYKHPTTSILMSHARSVICLLAGLSNIRLVNYASTRIKKAVTGSGHASKVQIQKMITEFLHLKKAPEPVDVTDALALALSFVYIELRGAM